MVGILQYKWIISNFYLWNEKKITYSMRVKSLYSTISFLRRLMRHHSRLRQLPTNGGAPSPQSSEGGGRGVLPQHNGRDRRRHLRAHLKALQARLARRSVEWVCSCYCLLHCSIIIAFAALFRGVNPAPLDYTLAAAESCPLDKLPDELLTTVFSWLVEGDLGRCASTSRRFNKISNDLGIWWVFIDLKWFMKEL